MVKIEDVGYNAEVGIRNVESFEFRFVIVDCGLRNVLTANQEQNAQGMAHTL